MPESEENKESIDNNNQEATGNGNIQAIGKNINISQQNTFLSRNEKFLVAELLTSLAFQSTTCLLTVILPSPFLNCAMCFPIFFIPNAIYGFFAGTQLGDKKIITLSIILGVTTIIPWVLAAIIAVVCSVFSILGNACG